MSNTNTIKELKLHSPAGVEPAIFTWPLIEQQTAKKDGGFVAGDEIVKTIRLVFEDYPELYQQNLGLATCDIHSYANMKELCDKFNKIIDTHIKLNRGTEAFSARLEQRPSSKLFRHILAQIYSRAVIDPDKLRDYQPFSPSVYGETSPDLIDSILKNLNLNEDQTFIDLGSGVGNVVLHVAALANCKHVYGIEYEETPATYARAMADEFRSWMRWYGKQYTDFQLEQGDFLVHPSIDERIREADVIFVNNYVFGSKVNHDLKVKFMNMKDGAKIISSREFCPEGFRLNDRTKNDLGAIMHVTKPEQFSGKVSWSDKSVQYYLHVIDHSKLALYYEKLQHGHSKGIRSTHLKSNDEDYSLSPSSSNNSSTKRKYKLSRLNKSKSSLDNDSDSSADEISIHLSKRSKDYHSTLNEFHPTRQTYEHNHPNQRFNYQTMTKLSNENLQLQHFRDCLFDHEDQEFFHSINTYLNSYRQRLFNYRMYMKSNVYREHIQKQLDQEKELNKTLKSKVNSLENHMKILLDDTINLLKLRTNELGVEQLERPVQLITYANDISNKHKELRTKVAALEKEITEYDYENEKFNQILQSIQTNGHYLSAHDNTYSTLLANMSRQTQQQETIHHHHQHQHQSNRIKDYSSEKKSGFTIPKKTKKSSTDGTHTTNVNNLLSAKQLEPLQVHSVTQPQGIIQTVSVKTLLNHSPTSKSSHSSLSDELSRTMIMQSPRKKRDFYGKSSGGQSKTPTPPSSPAPKSHRIINQIDSPSATNNRPSSTPACTTTSHSTTANLPDRPVSNPPLKSSP